MPKDQGKVDSTIEPLESVSATVTASAINSDLFDFTLGVEVMDDRTKAAYYRVRRAALIRGDAALLPEGKKLTRDQIEEIIGGELGQVEGPRPCCV